MLLCREEEVEMPESLHGVCAGLSCLSSVFCRCSDAGVLVREADPLLSDAGVLVREADPLLSDAGVPVCGVVPLVSSGGSSLLRGVGGMSLKMREHMR